MTARGKAVGGTASTPKVCITILHICIYYIGLSELARLVKMFIIYTILNVDILMSDKHVALYIFFLMKIKMKVHYCVHLPNGYLIVPIDLLKVYTPKKALHQQRSLSICFMLICDLIKIIPWTSTDKNY